jgi:hypothetical protein
MLKNVRVDKTKADLSSRKKLKFNKDGSVDLYFGPKAHAGKESNWVQTMPNKAWFPYFRFYSPTQAFLDQTWVLPDIAKSKMINCLKPILIRNASIQLDQRSPSSSTDRKGARIA